MTGGRSVHTIHGIMRQEVSSGEGTSVEAPTVLRTDRHSLEFQDTDLTECFVTLRKIPKLEIKQLSYPEGMSAMTHSKQRQVLCYLAGSSNLMCQVYLASFHKQGTFQVNLQLLFTIQLFQSPSLIIALSMNVCVMLRRPLKKLNSHM